MWGHDELVLAIRQVGKSPNQSIQAESVRIHTYYIYTMPSSGTKGIKALSTMDNRSLNVDTLFGITHWCPKTILI